MDVAFSMAWEMGGVMEMPKGALRLAVSAGFLVLGACSSGGGGGGLAVNTPPANNTTPPPANNTSTPPANNTPPADNTPAGPVVIGEASPASAGSTVAVNAAGSTANFLSSPPSSTVAFGLDEVVLKITGTPSPAVAAANVGNAVAYFQGTTVENGVTYPVIALDIPNLSLHATNLVGDGSAALQGDGSKISFAADAMTYTAMGVWSYTSANTTFGAYTGVGITGFETPSAGIPVTGTANYLGTEEAQGTSGAGGMAGAVVYAPSGTGGMAGVVYAPSGTGTIAEVSVSGNVSLSVDFAAGTINGGTFETLENTSEGPVPWLQMEMKGTFSGNNISGTTRSISLGSAPNFPGPETAGIFGMTTAAAGTFQGKFYGPNAEELGLVWSLHDNTSDGGKTAVGVIGATKQ